MSDEEKNPVEGLPTPPAELIDETSAPEPEPEPEPEKPTTRTFALHESFDARCIHPTGNEPAGPFSFSDDFMTDFHTGVSYAFFNAARDPAHDTDYLQTQAITLYSNQSESHSMADRLVAAAGEKYGADILILDALQLALGRHGILGEGGIVLEAIFDSTKRKSDDVPKGVDQEESALFWESLLVRSAGEHKRRIVYLRDIGSIAKAAKPALAHILRASHNLRLKRSKDPASQIPDLVFVFGVCKESGVNAPMVKHLGLKEESASHGFVSYSMARKRLKSDKVAQQIPTLSDQLLSCARHPSSKGLATQFFLSRLVPTKAMDTNTVYHDIEGTWEPYALETWQRSTCFHVEALDSQSSAFRLAIQDCIDTRTSLISQSLLQFSLMQRGVTVEGVEVHIAPPRPRTETNQFYYRFLTPHVAEKIAAVAIGYAYSRSLGDGVTVSQQDALKVLQEDVLQAYLDISKKQWAGWASGYNDEDESSGSTSDVEKDVVEEEESSSVPASLSEEEKKDKTEKEEKEKEEKEMEAAHKSMVDDLKSRGLDKHEEKILSCLVNPNSLKTSSDDVHIDPKVIDALSTVVSLPLAHPDFFKLGVLKDESISGILLYGPPGTGKTMVCRALARECGASMLFVKPSDVQHKYVGESEKAVRSIFSIAAKITPCVVFIDEVDAIFRRRTGEEKVWYVSMLTEFMQAMDGLNSKIQHKGVIVIGATNRPYDLDEAILRRLPCRMLIDLPGPDARTNILRTYLKNELLSPDINIDDLATLTQDYSGSDLKNLCVNAAMASVKQTLGVGGGKSLDQFKKAKKGRTADGKENDGKEKVEYPTRVITKKNLLDAFLEVRPSFTQAVNAPLYQWHQSYSSDAATKAKPPSTEDID